MQKYLVESTRLGIPAIVHEESCAGYTARGATCFPQAIGLASTWEPNLVEGMTDVIRTQMRAVGAHQALAPVLDVARDPRWGRVEETFGEDPYLISRIGVAYVKGLQGEDRRSGGVATGKHFLGYGASEGGLNWAPAHIPRRELLEVYLTPFEAAVREAKLGSMMTAYHELDGIRAGPRRSFEGLLRATGVRRRGGPATPIPTLMKYSGGRQLAEAAAGLGGRADVGFRPGATGAASGGAGWPSMWPWSIGRRGCPHGPIGALRRPHGRRQRRRLRHLGSGGWPASSPGSRWCFSRTRTASCPSSAPCGGSPSSAPPPRASGCFRGTTTTLLTSRSCSAPSVREAWRRVPKRAPSTWRDTSCPW
jgi:hypothetical protein